MAQIKYISYNRVTGEYKIGNKKVNFKEFWYMAKELIIKKPGCLIQDDKYLLMYAV